MMWRSHCAQSADRRHSPSTLLPAMPVTMMIERIRQRFRAAAEARRNFSPTALSIARVLPTISQAVAARHEAIRDSKRLRRPGNIQQHDVRQQREYDIGHRHVLI